MNKKLMIGVAAGFAAAACVAAAKKKESRPSPTIWEKMQEKMEEMPEDFPPRMMFDNVEATKTNTEEILTLLRHDNKGRADAEAMATT
ncbi:MAG: hypothetical protein QNM02_16195 [Acidimicrobiia bacterium]|nr:hypothetical protein [Acidimicrobiia bacterium]